MDPSRPRKGHGFLGMCLATGNGQPTASQAASHMTLAALKRPPDRLRRVPDAPGKAVRRPPKPPEASPGHPKQAPRRPLGASGPPWGAPIWHAPVLVFMRQFLVPVRQFPALANCRHFGTFGVPSLHPFLHLALPPLSPSPSPASLGSLPYTPALPPSLPASSPSPSLPLHLKPGGSRINLPTVQWTG